MTCLDCGRTNPPGGIDQLYRVCENRIDCLIHRRKQATAPDKVLKRSHAAELPGLGQ